MTSASVGPLPKQAVNTLEQNLDTYALNRSTASSINVRDNILPDRLDDGLPAQFVYEPADCRLFYTPLSIIDPVEQWRQAAEAAWGSGGCVAGGLDGGNADNDGAETNGLERRALSFEQRRSNLEMGKVISMPERKPPRKNVWWTANHDARVHI